MKLILILFGLVLLSSCVNDPKTFSKVPIAKDSTHLAWENRLTTFNKNYDLTDLRTYVDSSKFVGRLRYAASLSPYYIIIELHENVPNHSPGLMLLVKQIEMSKESWEATNTSRILPFNQLCYFYYDTTEVKQIKTFFKSYSDNKITIEEECGGCFDPMLFQIEIYDYGKCSFVSRDFLSKSDSKFLFYLFDKVNLCYQKPNMLYFRKVGML